MDPFAAVSLAGNILQFLASARSVYQQVNQIRTSVGGLTQKQEEMLSLASDLENASERIASTSRSFQASSMTSTEKRIRELGDECQLLSRELQEHIQTRALKDRSSLLRATTGVIMGTWKLPEADKKMKRLTDLQKTLFKLLLAHISHQQAGLGSAMTTLIEQNRRLEINRAAELKQLKAEIASAADSLRPLLSNTPSEDSLRGTSARLLGWGEQAELLRREQDIVQSLRFEGMLHRREEIPKAHKNTFEWVFNPRLHFTEWLETQDEGVYWVSGDPGSGKSTLMKYLGSHDTTHQSLRKWAGDKELIVARFFFWFSGTSLQKSQEGLLRSLLFEICRQCPSAIQAAFPVREASGAWEKAQLLQSIRRLCRLRPSTRFCFFIDGLDEYRGEPGADSGDRVPRHVSEIISVINALSSLPYVKLCVSSRPWRAFEQAFGGLRDRKLYVNDENRGDIRLYIHDRFERSEAFLASSCDGQELAALVEEMVKDSRGVFIWVFLVVESLLRGLSNEDRLVELRRRLSETPKTLNELFERMLSSVEGIYQEQAAQILHVALRAASPMYVVVYSFIGDDAHNAIQAPTRAWTPEQCMSVSKQAAVRISVRCPDLVKIRTPSRLPATAQEMTAHQVDFLHRTVRDFLALEDTQERLNQRLTKAFDADMFICRGLLMQLKAACVSGDDTWASGSEGLWQVLDAMCLYVRQLEERTGLPQTELLDELHDTIAQQMGKADFLLGGDSFLGIMVRKRLHLYTQQKLPRGLASPGIPLLHCAIWPGTPLQRPPMLPSVDMINLLLGHGAKPNADSGQGRGESIWYEYVTWLYKRDDARQPDAREVYIAVTQSLLRHGADAGLKCVVGRTEARPAPNRARGVRYPIYKSVLEVVRDVFGPEERVLIEELIRERRSGTESVLRWLRWR